MSAVSTTLTVSGTLQTQNGGSLSYAPPALTNAFSVGQSYELALTSTPVQVTLPANTQFFAVIPPLSNTTGIQHKWNSGDTVTAINAAVGIPCLGVDPSHLTFYLSATSALVVTIWSA